MSLEQELKGSYKFSVKEWSAFKKRLAQGADDALEKAFKVIQSKHQVVADYLKSKDVIHQLNNEGGAVNRIIEKAWDLIEGDSDPLNRYRPFGFSSRATPVRDVCGEMMGGFDVTMPNVSLYKTAAGKQRFKVVKLTKKAFLENASLKVSRAKVAEHHFYSDDNHEVQVTLNHAQRVAKIHIRSGNRSVQRAEGTVLHKLFFQSLGAVKWGRNTGGFCTYLEEDLSDNYDSMVMHQSTRHQLGSIG